MIMETTTNTGKNQKFRRKVREESVETIYNISFSLKFFIQDPLNVFAEPLEDINIRIMWYDFKRNQKYENIKNLKKKLKSCGIEVF